MLIMTFIKRLLKKEFASLAVICAALSFMYAGISDAAGISVYQEGDKYVKLGGRIIVQYDRTDPSDGETEDELFFRSMCPFIEGSLYKDWSGKFQFDLGKASGDNEVDIKDAYIQYSGFDGVTVKVGNTSFPFSREWLTSVKYHQLVERTFVGDHNYGSPARQLGVHLTGEAAEKTVTWRASLASGCIDPDAKKLDFDSPVNIVDDWNQGWMIGGRIDYHPFGQVKFSQGDFSEKIQVVFGLAAFTWDNDGDNNTYTDEETGLAIGSKPDVDAVTGFEISAAFRGAGFSADAEYNLFNAETVDAAFTGGLYEGGETELKNWTIEGGYMVITARMELVAGYQSMDADTYEKTWTRTSVGLNWFFHKHDIKFQATYRMGKNLDGQADNDADELMLRMQYVF